MINSNTQLYRFADDESEACIAFVNFVYSNLKEMREKFGDAFLKKHGMKLGFMSPFIKASAYALRDQPIVNAVIDENEMVYRDYVDISVAVATPKVGPLIKCAMFSRYMKD